MRDSRILDILKNLEGNEIGTTDWFEINQERINQFAECTEDRQWIHTDEEMAKKGPFGRPIAHGFLLLSLLGYLTYQYKIEIPDVKMRINYGLNRVRFIQPVPAGSKIRSRGTLKTYESRGPGKILITIENIIDIKGWEKPALMAETLYLIIF